MLRTAILLLGAAPLALTAATAYAQTTDTAPPPADTAPAEADATTEDVIVVGTAGVSGGEGRIGLCKRG